MALLNSSSWPVRIGVSLSVLGAVTVVCVALMGGAALPPGTRSAESIAEAKVFHSSRADCGAAEHLRDLVREILSAEAIHIRASATVGFLGAEPCGEATSGSAAWGAYEYWGAGDRYRIDSLVDPAVLPGMQVSVAYDGARFSLLLANGVLSIGDTDHNTLLPTLPNPLFELLQFLVPLSDANQATVPRWVDLRAAPFPAIIDACAVNEGGEALVRLTLPGSVYEGRAYEHHVYVAAGAEPRVIRIERACGDDRLTSLECSEHAPVGNLLLPRRVRLTGFDADGSVGAETEMTLTLVALGAPIDSEVFHIPFSCAARVWDDVRGQFVRSAHEPG